MTHTGRAGRVLPGSTAERLLDGAPSPVAVAPKGHAQRSGLEAANIGCGHDGSASALTLVTGGTQVKVIAWYDNEWGYSSRLVDLAQHVLAPVPQPA
jgi:hypothetical protein